jgi:predicted unusual protein kinase regulating ubiquinone biosynthesis (AarF/ABC1/UbiB family)/CubicO group peptidase (beta-lactamase class C family)
MRIDGLFSALGGALVANPLEAKIIGGRFRLVVASSAWVLDLGSDPPSVTPCSSESSPPPPDLDATITYKSAQVFLDLYERRIAPHTAFVMGSVSIDGDMSAVPRVKRAFDVLRAASSSGSGSASAPAAAPAAAAAAAASSADGDEAGRSSTAPAARTPRLSAAVQRASGSSSSSSPRLADLVTKVVWRDTPSCELCNAAFSFMRRRHHCRVCHKCICDACSAKLQVRVCVGCNAADAAAGAGAGAGAAAAGTARAGVSSASMESVATERMDREAASVAGSSAPSSHEGTPSRGVSAAGGAAASARWATADAAEVSASALAKATGRSPSPPAQPAALAASGARAGRAILSAAEGGASGAGNGIGGGLIAPTPTPSSPSSSDPDAASIDRLYMGVADLQTALAAAQGDLASLREESAARGAAALDGAAWTSLYSVCVLLLFLAWSLSSSRPLTGALPALVLLAAILYFSHVRPSHPVSRRVRAFYAVGVVLVGLRGVRKATEGQSEEESQPAWDAAHRTYARFIAAHMVALRGLWVKVGQYMSSRADIAPAAYINELARLQDANPADDFDSVVRAVIEAELGAPLASIFASVDPVPIGSASIAQVHRARLARPAIIRVPRVTSPSFDASTGVVSGGGVEWTEEAVTDVVLKVQHPGIDGIMRQDLWTLQTIVRVVAALEKDYDFRPVISEWARESVKELNFIREAAVTRHMAHVTAAARLACGVPEVVSLDAIRLPDGAPLLDLPVHRARLSKDTASAGAEFPTDLPAGALSTRRVLLLQFIDAVKVTDLEAVDAATSSTGPEHAGRTRLLAEVCEAYATYLHIEGVFSGDPHPANVLVDKRGKAWLIDYGLTKVLPPAMRVAFANMVASAKGADAAGLLDSFDDMGLVLSRENPSDDLDNIRFLLRDTLPPKESKERFYAMRKVWGERIKVRKAAKLRRPVESWPADLLLYLRAGEILRGLGASLAVRVPYLKLMASASLAAVRADRSTALDALATAAGHGPRAASRRVKVASGAEATAAHTAHLLWVAAVADAQRHGGDRPLALRPYPVVPSPLASSGPAASAGGLLPLEARLAALLRQHFHAGLVTGAQVAVWRGGAFVADVALGELGPYDPRPVTSRTLFNVFSVTKGVTTAILHALVDEVDRVTGVDFSYDTPVAELWPAFASRAEEALPADAADRVRALAAAKARTTVRHVLTHSTGLQHAIPSDISMTKISDLGAMMTAMEAAVPVWAPGAATSYHYYTMGFLAAGVMRGLVQRLAAHDAGWAEWVRAADPARPFSVGRLLRRFISEPLGLADDMFIGLPAQPAVAAAGGKDKGASASEFAAGSARLAVLCGSATGRLGMGGRGPEAGSGAGAGPGAGGSGDLGAALQSMLERAEKDAATAHPVASSLALGASGPLPLPEARAADMRALVGLLSSIKEKVYLFDPRIFNRDVMRRGEIPAANGHFTARALAKMYASLAASAAGGGAGNTSGLPVLVSPARARLAATSQTVERQQTNVFVQGGTATNWGLGFQLYSGAPKSTSSSSSSAAAARGPGSSATGKQLWGRLRNATASPLAQQTAGSSREESSVERSASLAAASAANLGLDEAGAAGDAASVLQRAVHPTSLREDAGPGIAAPSAPAVPGAASGGPLCFGHSGLGGSLAFADPVTGAGVAILLNQLSQSKEVTGSIVRLIAEELGLTAFQTY